MGNSNSNYNYKQKKGGNPNVNNNKKFLNEIHLTDDDFEIRDGRVYLKNKDKYGLIAFYAPWCHFCTELAPYWNQYANQMNDTSFNFFAVDCTDSKCQKVANALGISGYPTIKFVDPNTKEVVTTDKQDGGKLDRSKEGIRRFLEQKNIIGKK